MGLRKALLASLLLGCSPAPRTVGSADGAWQSTPRLQPSASSSGRGPGDAHAASSSRPLWEHAALAAGLRSVGNRAPSEHLDGQHERTVRVNDLASSYEKLSDSATMPERALLVELHYPAGATAPDVIYAMEKRAAGFAPEQRDWELVVLDSDWRVQARGKLPLCGRCHLAAPHDGLFGLARIDPSAPPRTGKR